MTSSKYIQLSDKILMEYEYFNYAESTSDERKEYCVPVTGAIYEHIDGIKYLVSESLTKNRANNVSPKISNFSVSNNLYCLDSSYNNSKKYLSKDSGTNFKDAEYYMSITPTSYIYDIDKQPNGEKIRCDKVKIYFATSYNEGVDDRYTITISSNYKYFETEEDKQKNIYTTKQFILANYILDEFENVPTPFLIGERLYSRVIEFYVPSVYENRANMFGEELVLPAKIDIKFSNIYSEAAIKMLDGDSFINRLSLVEEAAVSIASVDQYATVFANVEEIDDYFKFEGSTKNTWKTFSDFISDLPGTVNDYILMHDITVNELITNTAQDEPDWKITTHNIITQTDDFDEPVLFRPVIKYSNCIACVIDYTLRIYCNANNTQIIKRATFQNFNFSKYGKKMIKINLGVVPPQINVYNKIDDKKVSDLTLVNRSNINILGKQEKIYKTSYITSFRDRMNIKASIAPVKIDNITE